MEQSRTNLAPVLALRRKPVFSRALGTNILWPPHQFDRPSKISDLSLGQTFSKFGEGGLYYFIFHKFCCSFQCKIQILKALLTDLKDGRPSKFLSLTRCSIYSQLEEGVCNMHKMIT